MKIQLHHRRPLPFAFTLIEMLVVIAIIVLLAGMLIPLTAVVTKAKAVNRAKAEIAALELAINSYSSKKGFYPPDGKTNVSQLFYELWGTVSDAGGNYFSNSFNAGEAITRANVQAFFGADGFINSSPDKKEIQNFIQSFKADKIRNINTAGEPVWVFAVSSKGPLTGLKDVEGRDLNPIRYTSSNPTHNANSFDLWVDVLLAGKTNRISNWSKDPEVVGN